jgi:hypothetical protein
MILQHIAVLGKAEARKGQTGYRPGRPAWKAGWALEHQARPIPWSAVRLPSPGSALPIGQSSRIERTGVEPAYALPALAPPLPTRAAPRLGRALHPLPQRIASKAANATLLALALSGIAVGLVAADRQAQQSAMVPLAREGHVALGKHRVPALWSGWASFGGFDFGSAESFPVVAGLLAVVRLAQSVANGFLDGHSSAGLPG